VGAASDRTDKMVRAGRRCQTDFSPGSLLGNGREYTQGDRVSRLSARAPPLQGNIYEKFYND
jgi:hypothetical protein